jgi:hypothetical protein
MPGVSKCLTRAGRFDPFCFSDELIAFLACDYERNQKKITFGILSGFIDVAIDFLLRLRLRHGTHREGCVPSRISMY